MSNVLLSLTGLTKAYPGVIANKNVSFNIKAGEVHALLGENGAGKSTLVKMIYGLVKPDRGKMIFSGVSFFVLPLPVRNGFLVPVISHHGDIVFICLLSAWCST